MSLNFREFPDAGIDSFEPDDRQVIQGLFRQDVREGGLQVLPRCMLGPVIPGFPLPSLVASAMRAQCLGGCPLSSQAPLSVDRRISLARLDPHHGRSPSHGLLGPAQLDGVRLDGHIRIGVIGRAKDQHLVSASQTTPQDAAANREWAACSGAAARSSASTTAHCPPWPLSPMPCP